MLKAMADPMSEIAKMITSPNISFDALEIVLMIQSKVPKVEKCVGINFMRVRQRHVRHDFEHPDDVKQDQVHHMKECRDASLRKSPLQLHEK
jgi:hypothetical protein